MASGSREVPFQAHIELLRVFLAHRDEIVDRIQAVLNAQRQPADYLQDSSQLARDFEDCFFSVPGMSDSQSRLRGQLESAHSSSGFRPREIPGLHNGPAEPAEMMTRVFHLWQQTRWPGRNGRVRYANTLFNLYVVRSLELLSLRLWDEDSGSAGGRLAQVQDVLDRLWSVKTADQPAFVRDARWLIQLAQCLATDDLGAYFVVAEQIVETLPAADRIEIHKAGVRMAAGHLRSQIRHYSTTRMVPFDDHSLVLNTRTTNALDFALLIHDLVPLLDAYENAVRSHDDLTRLELADAICQGMSPDPELFLNRVELLAAYSIIEPLFVGIDADGRAAYTPIGQRHVQRLQEYEARIGRVTKPLSEDCPRFRPLAGAYSPYGVLYGFSADLLKHMVLKASQADAVSRFGLEDVFVAGDKDKLAWVSSWRKLPHISRDLERLFDYPQQFAEDVFDRVEHALHRRVYDDEAHKVVRTGRLVIQADSTASPTPDLPTRYIVSSDKQMLAAHLAEPCDERQLARDRLEGKFVLSYQTPGGWAAITKAVLTEVLGAGRDAKIVGLPPAAARALTLTCPRLVVVPEDV